jgi:hypothetical protein
MINNFSMIIYEISGCGDLQYDSRKVIYKSILDEIIKSKSIDPRELLAIDPAFDDVYSCWKEEEALLSSENEYNSSGC